jgi:hypothetical protein
LGSNFQKFKLKKEENFLKLKQKEGWEKFLKIEAKNEENFLKLKQKEGWEKFF